MEHPTEFEMGLKRREHMHLAICHLRCILEQYCGPEWPLGKWEEEVCDPIEKFIEWLETECPGVA